MSSRRRIEVGEDWLYDLKLRTKAQRRKAMNNTNIEIVEYYKFLVSQKKHFYTARPIHKIYEYEQD